jgi:hypothetical protein
MKVSLFIVLIFVNFSVYAFSNFHKEILTHCPSIHALKYRKGTFTAVSYFNNTQIRWVTNQTFPETSVKIVSFNNTNRLENCIGGACAINCIYNTNASSKILFLGVFHQNYRITKAVHGPWKNDICAAKQAELCTFYIIPNTFKWYLYTFRK